MTSWYNDTGELPDLIGNDYEIPLLGAFLFYFVQVSELLAYRKKKKKKKCWIDFLFRLDRVCRHSSLIPHFLFPFLGSVRYRLCRRSCWQHARHLRRPTLHENADSHQSLHPEFGSCRRVFPYRHTVYHDNYGPGILAFWQRHVQGALSQIQPYK